MEGVGFHTRQLLLVIILLDTTAFLVNHVFSQLILTTSLDVRVSIVTRNWILIVSPGNAERRIFPLRNVGVGDCSDPTQQRKCDFFKLVFRSIEIVISFISFLITICRLILIVNDGGSNRLRAQQALAK